MGEVKIVLGDGVLDSHDLAHIRDAEVIILPQICPFELYQACTNSSALIFPNYQTRFKYPGKVGQSLLFKQLKFPHPETRPWPSVTEFRKTFQHIEDFPHRIPFVLKADGTHEAEGLFVITDQTSLESSLQNLTRFESSGTVGFISQELIHAEGNVLRAVILGRTIITYWKRGQNPSQIITTVSRGAKIDKGWRNDLQEKGRIEAQKFSAGTGSNLAAIDFVFSLAHLNPEPLFLEVNYYFGRRGLGGSIHYYRLLLGAIQEWLKENGFDPESVTFT